MKNIKKFRKPILLFIVFALFLFTLAPTVSALVINLIIPENSNQTESLDNTNSGSILSGGIWDLFSSFNNANSMTKSSIQYENTLRDGGFNYASDKINSAIAIAYNIIYPIGIATMLLSWCFSIAKAGISSAVDFKDKNSLIRAIMSLVIGIFAIMIAPKLLTELTQLSRGLCNTIFDRLTLAEIILNINIDLTGILSEATFNTIVLLIIDLILMINILWIALLQCISPLFVAFFGGENTRKLAINFIKEYFIALLVPPLTLIYYYLAMSMASDLGILGIIGGIVLGISTLGIASKKLPRLLN